MRITFVLKGTLEILPPMLPRIIHAADSERHISLVCTDISQPHRTLLEEYGVKIYVTQHENSGLFIFQHP